MEHRPPDPDYEGSDTPVAEQTLVFEDTQKNLSETLLGIISSIGGETVTLRWLLRELAEQGLLILCVLLTIPFLFPVSVPGVSTLFGAAIVLVGIGITLNRVPWLPKGLLDRTLDVQRLVPVLRKGAGMVRRMNRLVRPRMKILSTGALMNRLNGLGLVCGGALLALPLGLVPLSNTLPAVGVMLLAVGIAQGDGLFVLLGYLFMAATVLYFGVLMLAALAAGQGLSEFILS